MDIEMNRENLMKLNVRKLKVFSTNLAINFKTKWRKSEYIEAILKVLAEKNVDLNVKETNMISLGENFENNEQLDGFEKFDSENVQLCSTPIIQPNKKRKGELLLNSRCHKFFREISGKDGPEPDTIKNWSLNPNPKVIPKITSVQVYDYLVQQKSNIDNTSNKHFKGFVLAVAHDSANDVINGIETSLVYEQFLFIKSRCYPSMRSDSYIVFVVLDHLDCVIYGGGCECAVGKSGKCSHVGALLLFLERYADMTPGDIEIACTSTICGWKAPKLRNVDPKPLREISLNRPKLYSNKKLGCSNEKDDWANFDPRHPDNRVKDPERIKSFVKALVQIYPQTGAKHFWNLDEALTFQKVTESVLENFVRKQNISQEFVDFIEKETSGQSSNDLWKTLRVGRITSSMFGQILGCKEKTLPRQLWTRYYTHRSWTTMPGYHLLSYVEEIWNTLKERNMRIYLMSKYDLVDCL